MIPNVEIKPNVNTSNSIIGSRAYTFLDSYIYMKNQRYNALYEKNKEILAIENNAISIKSANVLYNAFVEEARILDSIVIRIRNFALRIKPDVIENINILIPSMNAINDFDNAISTTPNIPKYKYIHYKISPIEYENMASFINLYKMEINTFTSINTQTVNKDNPFIRDKATQYLIQTARERSNVNKEMLEMEEIKIINQGRLKNISKFFRHKNQYISTINQDFKTFQFYLRQYSGLREITSLMKPTELRNGDVLLSGSNKAISFNDYFVLYKHFHAMIKYMINIISYHEQQFFNKIYGLQSNIESYANIVNEVLDYVERINRDKSDEDESLNEAYNDGLINSDTLDSHNLINGNYAASVLMNDDTSSTVNGELDNVLDDFLNKNNLELVEPESSDEGEFQDISHDTIKDVKDEVISNFNEYEYNSDNGGVEICTLRDSWRL